MNNRGNAGTADLMKLLGEACYATDNWTRHHVRTRWVMDRAWYDQLRSQLVTEDQERQRAAAHANALISITAEPPLRCPVCPGGPFADYVELSDHMTSMADPAMREPNDADCLYGVWIEVRDGSGEPHLEWVQR